MCKNKVIDCPGHPSPTQNIIELTDFDLANLQRGIYYHLLYLEINRNNKLVPIYSELLDKLTVHKNFIK